MSQPRAPSRLRALAKDYADGHLDRGSYLRARTQFLDALGASRGTASMAPVDDPRPAPARATSPTATRLGRWIIAAVAPLILLGAVGGFLLLGGEDAALPERIAEPAVDPGTRLPPLSSLLTRRSANDVCARAAGSTETPVYGCQDRFNGSDAPTPLLNVVPAEIPFALTIEQYDDAQLLEWCQRHRDHCQDAPGQLLSTPRAQAHALAAWLTRRTGQTYRLASRQDWEQAVHYGVGPEYAQRSGVRLVRELALPILSEEATALESWWRRNHLPAP